MIINEKKMSIELTADEMKKAREYNSDEYIALQAARTDYPKYRVIELKKRKAKSALVKLDLTTIKAYVAACGSDDQKTVFSRLTEKPVNSAVDGSIKPSFFVIKSWFLKEFPQVKQFKSQSQMVMAIMGLSAAQ